MAVTDGLIPQQGIYQQQKAEAEAAYQRALANLGRQRGQVLQSYGFNAEFDDEGNVSDYGVDPYNEYGGFQQLRRQQAMGLDAAEEESRLRGFGQRGFGAQDTQALRFAQGAQSRDFGQSFLENIYGLASGQRDALAERNSSFLGIEQDALYNALQNRLFNEAEVSEKERKDVPVTKFRGKEYTKKGLLYAMQAAGVRPKTWAFRHPEKAKAVGLKVPGKKSQKRYLTKSLKRMRKRGKPMRKIKQTRKFRALQEITGKNPKNKIRKQRLKNPSTGPRRVRRRNRRRRR